MLPMIAVRKQFGELLAADPTTLAPAADANVIALIIEDFTPGEDLVAADLTLADFDGSTPKAGALGTQQCGIDPITGDQVVTITDPVGGYRWETTGVTNLPQTVYGYGLYNEALTTLLAVEKFPAPYLLSAAGQEINVGKAQITIVQQPAS